ncbi:30S ribosomal protein S7 [Candidatus Borrarchaeum sp.]|uniref:30S ribosomal protein S7 n=1 Tax=Candidatus Borrarchaeum sp. TaxID=2846742 RepID=UPI00257EAA9B|nr:30S ribosomal protein S7 [Candidatus Borrarchaeum sp.]
MSEKKEKKEKKGKKVTSEILLFGKWSTDGIEAEDPGLKRYISLKPVIAPHSAGRHEHHRFRKSQVSIVERFINKLMRGGRNTGKKMRITKAVMVAFEIIHLRTSANPVEILVRAVVNSALQEETTRISYGGIVYHQAVDVAPQRRVDLSLQYLAQGIQKASFSTVKSFEEVIAEELIAAANNDTRSFAIKRRQEKERIALSAR